MLRKGLFSGYAGGALSCYMFSYNPSAATSCLHHICDVKNDGAAMIMQFIDGIGRFGPNRKKMGRSKGPAQKF